MKRIITIAIMAFSMNVFAQNTWTNVGSGFNNTVRVFLADPANNALYAGGSFTTADGNTANRVAKWSGSAWTTLGTGMNGYVESLSLFNGELYAGGNFTTAGGVTANAVAKWTGSAWVAMGTGFSGSTVGLTVNCFAVYQGELYAGGDFLNAGGTAVNHIAKWNGSAWVAVGSGITNPSPTKYINDMTVYNNELYIGGIFTAVNGVPANNIAKFNGTTWSAVGTGLNNWAGQFLISNNELFVGGNFTTAGGNTANYMAKWNATSWSSVGTGMNSWVTGLASFNGNIYAGGSFTLADGNTANHVAKFDGVNWTPVGTGMNNNVVSLTTYGNALFAGGGFTTADGNVANYAAKWELNVNTNECFNTPDGVEYVHTAGWSYKDYIIPIGFRIDSVYGDFDRPGYPANNEDYIFSYSPGTTVYDHTISTYPFNYMTENTSLYDRWIDLTSFNYLSVGLIRVYLPTNAGAVWNDLCFAISPSSTTCTETFYDTVTTTIFDTVTVTVNDTVTVTISDTTTVTVFDTTAITVTDTLIIDVPVGINPTSYNTIKCYPNPASDHLIIDNGNFASMGGYTIEIENSVGQLIFSSLVNQQQFDLDLTAWGNGLYFVKIIDASSNVIDIRKIVLQ